MVTFNTSPQAKQGNKHFEFMGIQLERTIAPPKQSLDTFLKVAAEVTHKEPDGLKVVQSQTLNVEI